MKQITKFQKHSASFLIKADVFFGKINVRAKVKQFLPRLGQAFKDPGE
jgi:hypothetical protein